MRYIIIVLLFILENSNGISQPLKISIDLLGARGTKSQDITFILQKAIDSCYTTGGGTVVIPPGDYTSTTVILKNDVTLDLRQGATLYASTDPRAYPDKGYNNTGSDHTPVLIYAKRAENISITGEGSIVGQPKYTIEPLDPSSFIKKEYLIAEAAGLEPMIPVRQEPSVSLIYLSECKNVTIAGISLIDSPFWGLHIHWSKHIRISGITIRSDLTMGVNSDGIDVDGSKDVIISDCIISTADDAIVMKTTQINGKHKSCENVLVTNCMLASSSCALKLGTESYDDFRHIIFDNNIIRNTNRALGIFIRDGGTASNIIFSNITAETNRKEVHWWGNGELLTFVILKRNFFSRVGRIHNVTVRNVSAEVQGTSLIAGLGDQTIKNIRLENIDMRIDPELRPDKRTTDGFRFQKVSSLSLDDITVRWSSENPQETWESSFSFSEVEGLSAEDIVTGSAFSGSSYPAIALDEVSNASFDKTYALPGTGTFFEIGEDVDHLYLIDNLLYNADTKYKMYPGIEEDIHIRSSQPFNIQQEDR